MRIAMREMVKNVMQERVADGVVLAKNVKTKRSVLKALFQYDAKRKISKSRKHTGHAFQRIRYQRLLLKTLKRHKEQQKRLREAFIKVSHAFDYHRLSKSLVTLQWNRMRNAYIRSLLCKSDEHHTRATT